MNKQWLSNLAANDTVIINSRRGKLSIDKVARVTKTLIILNNYNGKFRKSDGTLAGADIWNLVNLEEPDEKNVEAIHKDRLHRQIKDLLLVNLDSLPILDLLRIVDILKHE